MSTTPDELVTLLSRRLAGHIGDREVLVGLEDANGLSTEQSAAIAELRAGLAGDAGRGEREMLLREALEALALG